MSISEIQSKFSSFECWLKGMGYSKDEIFKAFAAAQQASSMCELSMETLLVTAQAVLVSEPGIIETLDGYTLIAEHMPRGAKDMEFGVGEDGTPIVILH